MRKNKLTLSVLAILISLVLASRGFSLQEATHEAINGGISQRTINEFSLNNYLLNSLGFKGGSNEFLNGFDEKGKNARRQVFWWLGLGGIQEDRPGSWDDYVLRKPTRSVNHFHNPRRTLWEEAGLNDLFLKLTITGQSSVLWSQNLNQNVGGTWSWQDARRYFYIALTGRDYDGEVLALTPKEKERYFADTFRAVGQLMHLVQDASVPEHVRNDIHIKPAYEAFVEKARRKRPTIWNDWIREPITFDKSILEIPSLHSSAPIPISRIIDTDIYVGDNPNATQTLPNSKQPIGISEYTNVNFLSPDTMFTDDLPSDHRHYFPYPKGASASIWQDQTNKRRYLGKGGDGDAVDHLAAVSFMYFYRQKYFPQYNVNLPVGLDGRCYDEYASKLIPRAIGYSAGLLKYFFRGELQVSALPIFYKNGIQYVRVKIKNMTPNETMENGYFVLAYRYTPTNGKPDGSDDKFGIAWHNGDKTSAPCDKLEYEKDMTIDFIIEPTIPIENYNSIKFTLAYRGTLGNEKKNEDGSGGAVIGKVFTLGEIKFNEEWDNGLTGKHPWVHTDFDTAQAYPGHGTTSNIVEGDTLIKDNIRFAGYKNGSANGSFIGVEPLYPGHEDGFPILITPKTSLQFKIDKMSINQIPPSPPGTTSHYQGLWLHFNNGLIIQLTREGQAVDYTPTTAIWTFDLGLIVVDNIYRMFEDADITIPNPLYLHKISFSQQLFELEEPSTVDHHQHMEIDFISIVEEKQEQ